MSEPIEAAIARVPHWRGLKNLHYERIEGGLTNRSYRVVIGEEQFALRINAPNSEALGLDREHEREVLIAAERAGIGPEVIYCSPEEGLLVTRWIEGRSWSLTDVGRAENIARLADCLREIHALPATGKSLDPIASIHRYAEVIEAAGITLPRQALRLWRCVASPKAGGAMHLCHNDIVHGNIIDAGSLHIVDWEYAAMGDPMFDLATVTRYHDFSAAQAAELLRCYLGAASPLQLARLETMQEVFDALHLFWLFAQKATSRLDGEIDEKIGHLLDRLENPL